MTSPVDDDSAESRELKPWRPSLRPRGVWLRAAQVPAPCVHGARSRDSPRATAVASVPARAVAGPGCPSIRAIQEGSARIHPRALPSPAIGGALEPPPLAHAFASRAPAARTAAPAACGGSLHATSGYAPSDRRRSFGGRDDRPVWARPLRHPAFAGSTTMRSSSQRR